MPLEIGGKSKTTKRQTLEQAAKSTKKRPAALEAVEDQPEETRQLFEWYLEMHGSEALTNCEIEAWSRLNRISLTKFELSALRKLDATYWKIYNDRNRKADP